MEEALSQRIIQKSIAVKENEKVMIQYQDDRCKNFVKCLIKEIVKCKGIPLVKRIDPDIQAYLLKNTRENRIDTLHKMSLEEVKNYDCFIALTYTTNIYEEKDIDKRMRLKVTKALKESRDIRNQEKKWVLLNYPSLLDAYKAKMDYDSYYKFAMESMLLDYEKMKEMIVPLKNLMEKTDKVRITGNNTDLTFSIKGMKAIPCLGEFNIPDGEIFTAPIKESVNGKITYNTPSPYQGMVFTEVSLTFENGKIVEMHCKEDDEKLQNIFDTDDGSRYIGEFALGFNPIILEPMGDILFDEKIKGSIHFTPGDAYAEADNGNHSSIHWDMVLIQRKEYGGGEIYFDDVLIRKDGLFVLPELQALNFDRKE